MYYTLSTKGDENLRKKQLLVELKKNIEENAANIKLIDKLNQDILEKDKAINLLNTKIEEQENVNNQTLIDELNDIILTQQKRIAQLEDSICNNILIETDNTPEETEIEVLVKDTVKQESDNYSKADESFKEKILVVSKEIGALTVSVVDFCNKIRKSNQQNKALDIEEKLEKFKAEALKVINKHSNVAEIKQDIKEKCADFLKKLEDFR